MRTDPDPATAAYIRRERRFFVIWMAVILLAYGVLLWLCTRDAQGAEESGRPYHVVKLVDLALGKVRQTHVHVEGFVTYIKKEADGDLHIRVCDDPKVPDMQRARCVVCECVPELPCTKPSIGAHVAVEGISRFDKENGHRWNEVHVVEKLTVLNP